MATVNKAFRALASGYLFPEINRRVRLWQTNNPGKNVLRLGIGNTTEALPLALREAMIEKINELGDRETYTGYGDEQGDTYVREGLVEYYKKFGVELEISEVFVSDGAKSDAANIQAIFATDSIIAVTDPAYPVYVDSNVASGRSRGWDESRGMYHDLVYLSCTEENNFIPPLPSERVDLIYLCNPNNPTGAVMNHAQLKEFVEYARFHKSVIIYDSAYSEYITEEGYPHSIYEIEGAKECAIELSSFSKFSGFTGVRLGWTIVPTTLMCADSTEGELNRLWNRRQTTFFNGASNIAQRGGFAALSGEGYEQSRALVAYYLENARLIREGLEAKGLTVYGGVNSPYIWAKTPNGLDSWLFFDQLLDQCNVVVTPGGGFGPAGKNFIRVSAYNHRENVVIAMRMIQEHLTI